MRKSWWSTRLIIRIFAFFIYINDLLQGLISRDKLFADHFNYEKAFASALNSDLLKLRDWLYQLKIAFNPDRAKQAKEVTFSRKTKKSSQQQLYLSNATVKLTHVQKHLDLQPSLTW